MKLRNVIVAGLLGLVVQQSNVAEATPDWSAPFYIGEIGHDNPVSGLNVTGIYVTPLAGSGVPIKNDTCAGTPSLYFLPNENYTPSNSQFKIDLALVMAAYMNNRAISFFIQGCNYGMPVVTSVKIN